MLNWNSCQSLTSEKSNLNTEQIILQLTICQLNRGVLDFWSLIGLIRALISIFPQLILQSPYIPLILHQAWSICLRIISKNLFPLNFYFLLSVVPAPSPYFSSSSSFLFSIPLHLPQWMDSLVMHLNINPIKNIHGTLHPHVAASHNSLMQHAMKALCLQRIL